MQGICSAHRLELLAQSASRLQDSFKSTPKGDPLRFGMFFLDKKLQIGRSPVMKLVTPHRKIMSARGAQPLCLPGALQALCRKFDMPH